MLFEIIACRLHDRKVSVANYLLNNDNVADANPFLLYNMAVLMFLHGHFRYVLYAFVNQ